MILSLRMKNGIPGTNPTIASYNASIVNFYNATGSLARFGNKNFLLKFEKRCSLLQRWRCSCKFKSRRIGSRLGEWRLFTMGNSLKITEVEHIFMLFFT
jgi:hypothetical protein